MASTRECPVGAHETNLEYMLKVFPRGIMIGSAAILGAIVPYEDLIYRYLALGIFATSTIIHCALNWKAIARHFLLALVTTVIPGLVMAPEFSISFLLGRVPILIMLMIMVAEYYSRIPMLDDNLWIRAPDARLIPPDAYSDMDKQPRILMLRRDEELFRHMNGGDEEQYHAPSQVSSEISLSVEEDGILPSSCDTMIRNNFWPNGQFKTHGDNDAQEDQAM
ncbi:hypothetical protein M426DRAFT_198751 [Hypoxylon sp. CI-4A]|nr:hypothetical protein M426DRAFT_198751 [Hypoxylon sp. CI-4A]